MYATHGSITLQPHVRWTSVHTSRHQHDTMHIPRESKQSSPKQSGCSPHIPPDFPDLHFTSMWPTSCCTRLCERALLNVRPEMLQSSCKQIRTRAVAFNCCTCSKMCKSPFIVPHALAHAASVMSEMFVAWPWPNNLIPDTLATSETH